MLTYLIRRILLVPPTLIGMTIIVFSALATAPGGIGASLISKTGEMRPDERRAREEYLNRRYGLDRPKPIQYLHWLNKVSPVGFATFSTEDPRCAAATAQQATLRAPIEKEQADLRTQLATMPYATEPDRQAYDRIRDQVDSLDLQRKAIRVSPQPGDVNLAHPLFKKPDLGDSVVRGRPVIDMVRESLPVTLMLQMIALPLSYACAIWLGIQQARKRGSTFDYSVSGGTLALWSIPPIWTSVLLIGYFANQQYMHWFPANGLNDLNEEAMKFLPTRSAFAQYAGFATYVIAHLIGFASLLLLGISLLGAVVTLLRRRFDVFPTLVNLIVASTALAFSCLAMVNRISAPIAMLVAMLIVLIVVAIVSLTRARISRRDVPPILGAKWLAYACAFCCIALGLRVAGVELSVRAPGMEGGWLFDRLYHIVLPLICLTYTNFAFLSRLSRGALLDNLSADFVRTARAKGLSERIVLYRHAFRNSLIPLITVVVNLLPGMIVGSVVVESIFGINGMGKLFVDAAQQRDSEMLLSITFVTGILDLTSYLIADMSYAIADPRVSYG